MRRAICQISNYAYEVTGDSKVIIFFIKAKTGRFPRRQVNQIALKSNYRIILIKWPI